jgi:hypothetical protein
MPRPRVILELTETYNINLPVRHLDQLRREAHERRVSVCVIIRELVERHLALEDPMGR